MAALARSSIHAKHMLQEFVTCLRPKRYRILQIGTFVFLARSHSCMAHTVTNMDLSKKQNNLEMAILESKFGWMKDQAPWFGMNGNNIRVITEPSDFYGTFKEMAQNAQNRIVIASLYLGTGQHEKELVNSIDEACKLAAEKDNFEIHILLDYTRGSRGGVNSSRTMLIPLLEKYRDKVNVYLYHSPDLRGLLKQYMPERYNEVIGLSHMKIYLVDDNVIISGANLSESYFTNRQDRYVEFRQCPDFTNYLTDIVKCMGEFTFHLQSDNSTIYPTHAPHPYEGSVPSSVFKTYAGDKIRIVKSKRGEKTPVEENDYDTWLCPLIQMGPFGITDDEFMTKQLFERMQSHDRILLASGYFNLTTEYMNTILNKSKGKFEILTASPEANGFFGASGISGAVPDAYTDIAQKFYAQVCQQCESQRISIYEYFRSQWTFHAKGLWYYLPNSSLPAMTFIGSPNFGHRSVYRDLECQVVVMTSNTQLQNQLHQEQKRLYESATQVNEMTFQQPERYVPFWVKLVTKFMRNFF